MLLKRLLLPPSLPAQVKNSTQGAIINNNQYKFPIGNLNRHLRGTWKNELPPTIVNIAEAFSREGSPPWEKPRSPTFYAFSHLLFESNGSHTDKWVVKNKFPFWFGEKNPANRSHSTDCMVFRENPTTPHPHPPIKGKEKPRKKRDCHFARVLINWLGNNIAAALTFHVVLQLGERKKKSQVREQLFGGSKGGGGREAFPTCTLSREKALQSWPTSFVSGRAFFRLCLSGSLAGEC